MGNLEGIHSSVDHRNEVEDRLPNQNFPMIHRRHKTDNAGHHVEPKAQDEEGVDGGANFSGWGDANHAIETLVKHVQSQRKIPSQPRDVGGLDLGYERWDTGPQAPSSCG